jgi:hypothetical protein
MLLILLTEENVCFSHKNTSASGEKYAEIDISFSTRSISLFRQVKTKGMMLAKLSSNVFHLTMRFLIGLEFY